MKINKILALGVLALMGFTSCDDPKEPEYTPADKLNGDQVYFPNNEATDVVLSDGQSSFDLQLARVKDDNALSVALTATATSSDGLSTDGIFTVPATVNFAAGEKEINYSVGVDFSRILMGVVYELTVKADTQGVDDPYALTSQTYTIQYSPWGDWQFFSKTKVGSYSFAAATSGSAIVPVFVRYSAIDDYQYQICVPAPFFDDFTDADVQELAGMVDAGEATVAEILDGVFGGMENLWVLDVNTKDLVEEGGEERAWVTMNMQPYYNFTDVGKTYISDCYTFLRDYYHGGVGHDQAMGMVPRNNMTFGNLDETQGIINMTAIVVPESDLQANEGFWSGSVTIQLPGNYKTLDMEVSYAGNFVGNDGQENPVISVTKTTDIAYYRYKLYEGQLSEEAYAAAVAEIKDDRDLPEVSENATQIQFPGLAEGVYTVVFVGWTEEGEALYDTSLTFNFESVKKNDPFKTVGTVEYTDGYLCSVFTGLDPYTWEVELQESNETPGLYRLLNPYTCENSPYASYAVSNGYMTINAVDPKAVYIEQSPLGINLNPAYGDLYAWSMAAYYMENGNALEDIAAAGWCGTLEDGVITFPERSLLLVFSETGDAYYANQWEDPDGMTWSTFMVDMTGSSASKAKHAPKIKLNKNQTVKGQSEFKANLKGGKQLSKEDMLGTRHNIR